MQLDKNTELKTLLKQYKDVFAWSFEYMKGLDPAFCQHHFNLHKDVKPVQQRRYRLDPHYAVKEKKKSTNYYWSILLDQSKRQHGLVQ